MPVNAIVTANATAETGVEIDAPFLTALGTPNVIVPTTAITIDAGETLTVDGSLVVNGTISGTAGFVDAVIDGGNSGSTYYTAFDIDGGGA